MNEERLALKSRHVELLRSLRYESGLYSASSKKVLTGYDKAWIRDNFYVGLALLELEMREEIMDMYNAFMSILLKHEWKIDYAINEKPAFSHQYIHPRYHPETFDEFWESWGNKQNDSVGALLYFFGTLAKQHLPVLQQEDEKRIIQKLITYLEKIEYWQDTDSGIWEEWEEIHASSLGACIAGLKTVKEIGFDVPDELIQKGEDMLHHELLPRESHDKFCDLSLLTLIYPYNLLSSEEVKNVIETIEYHLVKANGIIRYKGDHYYNENIDGWSEEAEWTFGFSFLALAYYVLGEKEKALTYLQKARKTINEKGEIPELYYSNSREHNENTPLAWSEAMYLIALARLTANQ